MAIQLLTKREAAKVARVSPRYLGEQIKQGVGPAVTTVGRKQCVLADELESWLRHCTVMPTWATGSAQAGA